MQCKFKVVNNKNNVYVSKFTTSMLIVLSRKINKHINDYIQVF